MLQVEAEQEEEPKEPAGDLVQCSPAALKPELDCRVSQSTKGAQPQDKPASPGPSCTGPNCLVAPMPGAKGAPARAEEAAAAPVQRLLSSGPMTQDASDHVAQSTHAAMLAKYQPIGLKQESAPAPKPATDDPDLPLPSPRTTASRSASLRHPVPAGARGIRSDFEMRFAPQSPALHPSLRGDFEMRFDPQAPAPQPQRGTVAGAAAAEDAALRANSPAPAGPAWGSREWLLAETARVQQQRQQRQQQAPRGPARPPMTPEEAVRAPEQQAAYAAAREAALARKRGTSGANAGGSLAAASAARTASGIASAQQQPQPRTAQQQQQQQQQQRHQEAALEHKHRAAAEPKAAEVATPHHRSEIERILLAASDAGDEAAGATRASHGGAPTRSRRFPPAPAQQQSQQTQRAPKRSAAAAAPHAWSALDAACALAALGLALVALFMAAAVLEDLYLRGGQEARQAPVACGNRPRRQEDTPLLLHWLALMRFLWRRCRRAYTIARRQLMGNASALPTSTHEGSDAVPRAVAAAAAACVHARFRQRSGAPAH